MKANLSGQQFGDYRLIRRLGGGQYGEIYLAEHGYSKAVVAIKILHAQPEETNFNLSDFISEARIFRIEHPNVVRIRDFDSDHGRVFLVMDYIQNGNLLTHHPRGTQVPWDVVASYAAQIAQGLQAVHDHGIVHRDVKPENLLMGQDGKILLGDFGIAIPSYTWDPSRKQMPKGTPIYIAPEQIKGKAVRESDQYSLGAVMYEWLTGSPPFIGSYEEVLLKQQRTEPTPPRELVPSLPAVAEDLIMRMLAKKPEQRFASMREFAVYLARIQELPSLPTLPMPKPTTTVPVVARVFKEDREGGIRTVAWSPNGQYIASAGTDKTVVIRDVSSGIIVYAFHGHTDELWCVAWSPDSKYIASTGLDRTVQVWEATTGYSRTVYMKHTEPVRSVAWSTDGKYLASAGDDKTVQVWDAETGAQVSAYYQQKTQICSVAWSPTGPYLAFGCNDSLVCIWNVSGKALAQICHGHLERVMSVAWSPDGEFVASASDDRSVRRWQASTAQSRSIYTQHENVVATVAWSPDGHRLASGSWDTTVCIWAIDHGDAVHEYRGHESWVNAVGWSPDGQYLVSGSWDNTVHIISL